MKALLTIFLGCFALIAHGQFDFADPEPAKSEETKREQAFPNPYRLGLKMAPIALLDPSLPTFQVGAEWQFATYRSVNLDLGVNPASSWLNPSNRQNSRGLKARLQFRNQAKRTSLRGFYTGPEAFYKYQMFDSEVVFGHNCQGTDESQRCDYYEFADISVRQHVLVLGLILGLEPLAAKETMSRLIFDFNVSLGFRAMREDYFGIPHGVDIFTTETNFRDFRDYDSPTYFVYPNIGINVRFGWWIS